MVKERYVIRVQPASNIRELIKRVLYTRPLLVDKALRILELLKTNSGCIDNDVVVISRLTYVRIEDIEYILRKLESVGMILREQDRLCLSDKFSKTLRQLAEVWEHFIKHSTERRGNDNSNRGILSKQRSHRES